MEEHIVHENSRISPIMLSIIIHSALVVLFIMEMNMGDISLKQPSEAQVIMLPPEHAAAAPATQTALAAPEIPAQPEPETMQNFPSFKQMPGALSDEDTNDLPLGTPEQPTEENVAESSAEEVQQVAEELPSTQSVTEQVASLQNIVSAQAPTSVVEDREQKTEKPVIQPRKTAEKLQKPLTKSITLADIGKRYQEQLYQERTSNAKGVAGVTILGDDNAVPTGEHIKHARYMEKLSAQIQKAWNRNRHKLQQPGVYEAEFFLSLNKDGSIRAFTLRRSSGSKMIDDFISMVYHDASSSFPPVPDNFRMDSYSFNVLVTLSPYVSERPIKFASSML